jgi:hypothetical protein
VLRPECIHVELTVERTHLYARISLAQACRRGIGLEGTGIPTAKQQLAGQVAGIDAIEIIDQQMADAGIGQIQAGDRTQSAEPDDQGTGLPEPFLALGTKSGQGDMPGVTQ